MNRLKKMLFFLFAIEICYAGTVTDLIDYREYRDFAENKGKYQVGNTNVTLTRTDGTVSILSLPIPDFSSTDQSAVGTLISPCYIAGVKHNGGYKSVAYGGKGGGHTYTLIDRNNHPGEKVDRHVPRLNKVVTDVVPTKVRDDATTNYKVDYEMFARVGTGTQYVHMITDETKYLAGPYAYLTGGTVHPNVITGSIISWDRGIKFPNARKENYLPIYLNPGDSGSPLWGYNKKKKEWELVAFGVAISSWGSYYIPTEAEFYKTEMDSDTMPDITNDDNTQDIIWSGVVTTSGLQGTGTISQGQNTWSYDGLKSGSLLSKATNEDLNFTKHLTFNGVGGTIKLQDDINMGAGKLTFENNYSVVGNNENVSWVGAGIDVVGDNTVTWKVKGQKGDNLHKIGTGTLIVSGIGKNEGGLNVGDGTVYLNQIADNNGNKQAFNNIDIVSGRATVVLGDANQVNPDNIRFMYRGGKLDINGNDLKFSKIVSYDNGAQIINKSNNESNIKFEVLGKDKYTTIYKGHFGEKDIENRDKINLSFQNGVANDKKPKYIGVTGGINIDGDIDFSSNNLFLVFQGRREAHADEKIGDNPIIGDYSVSKFKFNNLYVRNRNEDGIMHYGFVGGIYTDIEGNIIIEDKSSAVLGYVPTRWEDTPLTEKTVIVYDQNDQLNINENSGATELNDENTDDKIQKGTTIYKGNVIITDEGTLDVGAAEFIGGIEALNGGKVNILNSKIDAKLNFGDSVASVFESTVGKLSASIINNTFDIKEKSELLFDGVNLGVGGELNIDNSKVQIDNSKNVNGDILVVGKGNLIGNNSILNKITSNNGVITLKDTDVNKSLVLNEKSEAQFLNGVIAGVEVNDSLLLSEGTAYNGKIFVKNNGVLQVVKGETQDIEVEGNSLIKGIDTTSNNVVLSSQSTLDYESGKINSLTTKDSVVALDKTKVENIELLSSTPNNKSVLISKNNTINNLIGDNAHIEFTDVNIGAKLELNNKSEMITENGTLLGVNIDNSTLVSNGTKYINDTFINNNGVLQAFKGELANVNVDNGELILNKVITGDLVLNNKGKLSALNGEMGVINLSNSQGDINSSVINGKIFLNNLSKLNVVGTDIKDEIEVDNSMIYLEKIDLSNILTLKADGNLGTLDSNLFKVFSDNSEVMTQGGKISNLSLVNNSTLNSNGTELENLEIDNSKIISDASIFNQGITAKNNSNLDLKSSYVIGNLELNDGILKTDKTMITNDLSMKNSNGELNGSTVTGSISLDKSDIVLNGGNYVSINPIAENINTSSNIVLKNNSNLKGIGTDIVSNIEFVGSDISLQNSTLRGTLNGNGETELSGSTWYIEDNSDIKNLLTSKADIRFVSKKADEFHSLMLDSISGDSKITFNTNLETGESDKLIIRGDVGESFETEIDVNNTGADIELDKEIVMVLGKESVIDRIKVTNKTVDLGIVQGKVGVIKNNEIGLKPIKPSIPSIPLEPSIPTKPEEKPVIPSTPLEPSIPTKPVIPNEDGDSGIIVELPSYIAKETAGSTSTTFLSEYAGRVEAIKNQNTLFKSEIDYNTEEGFNYIGNTQYGKYESDKFRQYHQTIINNGFVYKTNDDLNNEWKIEKGVGFIYGKSTLDYEGDYTGRIDNYGIYGYLQFLNKDGYYIAPNFGMGYNENKINSEKFYTKSQNIGTKFGYQKKIADNLKLLLETGVDIYHISHSNYDLDFKESKYNGNMKGTYFVEIKPELKIARELEIKENKISMYAGAGIEYDKYLFGNKPFVNIISDKHKVETAMIDKGATMKLGIENSYKNINLTLEAEYFTGKYNNEKLKGNFKLKYKF